MQSPEVSALSAVVLAAGLSRRMGRPNKLLLPVAGEPLVRRIVSIITSLPFAEVVVVTGHQADAVLGSLIGLPVKIVHNADYEEGQMTSVRAGLASLTLPSEGVMVCLGDQPTLIAADYVMIARAFHASSTDVLVPTHRGVRGNPIVLPRARIADILARGSNFGCKQFVAKNSDLVRTFEMPNDHVVLDVDRPEDYASLAVT